MKVLEKATKAGIVCCSNGIHSENKEQIANLCDELKELNLNPVLSNALFAINGVESGTPQEKAKALMNFYKEDDIQIIFDISGGDLANTLLPYLDYDQIRNSEKTFWGYSDLTTILNAIYAKTGKTSILYQIRNLISNNQEMQKHVLKETFISGKNTLFEFPYEFYQGNHMEGVLIGGNIRCFLKLAGTTYFPDVHQKILLLEARSGTKAQILTYFSQLEQMGVFAKVCGILLGTFSQMEQEEGRESVIDLISRYLHPSMPLAKTQWIGHGTDAKAVKIGAYYRFRKEKSF